MDLNEYGRCVNMMESTDLSLYYEECRTKYLQLKETQLAIVANRVVEKSMLSLKNRMFKSSGKKREGSRDSLFKKLPFEEIYASLSYKDDYKVRDKPVSPEFWKVRDGSMFRYMFRMSWKVGESQYIPMTFVVDSGLVESLYLCEQAGQALDAVGKISKSKGWKEDEEVFEVELREGYVVPCLPSPLECEPANFVGIKFISKFGFLSKDDKDEGGRSFSFLSEIEYFGC